MNPGDAMDRCLIGRGVLTTSPFVVGPFCTSVGAQTSIQPWRVDPLTLLFTPVGAGVGKEFSDKSVVA